MASQKHFLQDRTALLLTSSTAFLTLVAVVLTLLDLGSHSGSSSYIVSYRERLGLNGYVTGTLRDMLSFVVAAILIGSISLVLSYKAYPVKRELALGILALTLPLLVFLTVVSNALLALR